MFQAILSPRSLNVEKLDKKFASLTKSRESILGLSTWIIRHKEFYKEIVDRWLDALSKEDISALTMFYVANDVIQNCGRKRAPEFREAFATVLERAVSLEKVKEIKAEVLRMITLWHERSIYDATFFKKLQDRLNDVEELESEEEIDDTEIIANFKLENLANSLEKLKTLEEELLVKEEFIEDVEEPGVSNIDNLIVKMDSKKELKKVDKFEKLVQDYLSLADKVMTVQKDVMLNLKYSSIFYRAQLEDAKKVAHAYRIYGKKVKMVEKALAEKLATLPEASPVLEEESPNIELNSNLESQSPGLSVISDANNENSNQSNNLNLSISPKMNENDSFFNTTILNEKCKSPLFESQNVSDTSAKDLDNDSKVVKSPVVVNAKEEEKIPISTVSAITSIDESTLKSPLMNIASKMCDKILKSPIVDVPNKHTSVDLSKSLNSEKILKSPLIQEKIRRTSTDQKSKSPVAVETVRRTSTDKTSKCASSSAVENTIDTKTDITDCLNNSLEEKELKGLSPDCETSTKKTCSSENEDTSASFKEIEKTSEPDLQALSDIENIDFLLEKSYNEQRTKSKASFKRKIDNLLKMKQSKTCKLSNDHCLKKNLDKSETPVSEEPAIVPCSNLNSENKSDISESLLIKKETTTNSGNLDDNEKICLSPTSVQIDNSKDDQPLEMTKNLKASDTGTVSESIPLSIAGVSSSFPNIPTEVLKNILDKHRTSTNQSSNTDPSSAMSGLCSLKTENEKLLDSNLNNVTNINITNDNKDISSGIASTLDSKTDNIKNNPQEESMQDYENNKNMDKDDKLKTENVPKENSTVKTTPLMENLQKLLKCFTERGSALEELKNSKTLKTLPTYSLGSTLKLYHILKEHHKNDNALNTSNDNKNSLSDISSQSASENNKSSVCSNNHTNAFAHSKNDNLEIMDMEVDSDDDSTK